MKNISNILKLIVLSTLLLVGCEEHLQVDTYNDITGGSFWQNPSDCQTYAYGIQAKIANLLHGSNNFITPTDGRTEMFRPGGLGPRLTGHVELHTQTATLGGGNWKSFYEIIHHCNLLLQEIEAIEFEDEAQKDEIRAAGYFFRAFSYFYLVRIYGDVPEVLEPTIGKPDLESYYSRAPKSEIFELIKSDIEDALGRMPDGIADKNFMSKPAVLALKAEVYMWTGKALTARNAPVTADLNTAIDAIDAIETDGAVSFNTGDWISTFTRKANDSPEYIWALYYDNIVGPENNVHNAITIRIDNVPDTMQGTFPIAVTDEGLNRIEIGNKMNTIYGAYQTVDAHKDPFNPYDTEPWTDTRDLRYINTMVDIYGDGSINVCIKFPGVLVETDNRRYWDNDLPIYRWTDMLLLKAEAMNTIGGYTTEVVDILNMTRSRGGLADYAGATDQNTLEDEIIDERARELLGENKYWWDLIRAHKVGINVDRFMTERGDDSTDPNVWDFYYWPIAESVLIQNQMLEQSPGYTVN